MIEQKFGPRRCKDTRKPLEKQCPDVIFYRCPECGALYPVTGGTNLEEKEILCCGKKAERLIPEEADSTRDVMDITYQITGGYNDNAVRVSWKMKPYGRHPEWIYLKTFTGGYLKYVMEGNIRQWYLPWRIPMPFVTVMKIHAWNVYFGVREDLSFMFMIDRPDSLRYPWIR